MSHDFGSKRRNHIADILKALRAETLTLTDAIDAIELDVFEQPEPAGQKVRGKTSALFASAVAILLVGLDKRGPADALDVGEALSDELESRGILAVLEG